MLRQTDGLPIMLHKMIFNILKKMFRTIRKHKFIVLNKLDKTNENMIFAVNHSCRYDIPYTCELLSRQCYVLVGKQPLYLIDRLAFILNGTVWVDRKDKKDKKRAKEKLISLLNNGANVVIFPEGTWNLTPSKPMLPLYWGIIDIARETKKNIVPVVLEYKDKKCYAAFGKAIRINRVDNKGEKIDQLSDRFATLKWKIWEKYPEIGFSSAEEWENEVKRRVEEYPKLDYEYERSIVRQC